MFGLYLRIQAVKSEMLQKYSAHFHLIVSAPSLTPGVVDIRRHAEQTRRLYVERIQIAIVSVVARYHSISLLKRKR